MFTFEGKTLFKRDFKIMPKQFNKKHFFANFIPCAKMLDTIFKCKSPKLELNPPYPFSCNGDLKTPPMFYYSFRKRDIC